MALYRALERDLKRGPRLAEAADLELFDHWLVLGLLCKYSEAVHPREPSLPDQNIVPF